MAQVFKAEFLADAEGYDAEEDEDEEEKGVIGFEIVGHMLAGQVEEYGADNEAGENLADNLAHVEFSGDLPAEKRGDDKKPEKGDLKKDIFDIHEGNLQYEKWGKCA